MQFCLFSTQQHWGGGETLVWTLAEELQKAGHNISWVARKGSEVAEHIKRHQGNLLHESSSRSGGLRDWSQLTQTLRRWKPDALVLNDTHAVTLAAGAHWRLRKPKPVRLAYKHTVFPLRSPAKYRWLCDKLICVSEAAKRTVVQCGLSEAYVTVIPGGCPEPTIAPGTTERIRAALGITPNYKLLVSVGNLLEIKGHADLIRALKRMEHHSDVKLVIAGQGEQEEHLKSLIHQCGLADKVQLLGYRDDPNDLLAAADLVVHPSHAEGLSLVLIQARMLAKPIVATPVGGAAEVLATDSADQLGTWLAPAKDDVGLAGSLQQALTAIEQKPAEIAENLQIARTTALRLFSIQQSAQALAELTQLYVR